MHRTGNWLGYTCVDRKVGGMVNWQPLTQPQTRQIFWFYWNHQTFGSDWTYLHQTSPTLKVEFHANIRWIWHCSGLDMICWTSPMFRQTRFLCWTSLALEWTRTLTSDQSNILADWRWFVGLVWRWSGLSLQRWTSITFYHTGLYLLD